MSVQTDLFTSTENGPHFKVSRCQKNVQLQRHWQIEMQVAHLRLHLRMYDIVRHQKCQKSDNGFAWISAQPLLEPLLNMHTASYMSVITYLNMLPQHVVFGLMIPRALSIKTMVISAF